MQNPRASWRDHPNMGGPAATLLMIHDQFRAASEQLRVFVLDESIDRKELARAFVPLARTLHHHHHAEELLLFPFVLRRTGAAPEHLVDDHQELTAAIAAVEREVSQASVLTFHTILITHLDREEALVIPLLLEMTPEEAWSLI